MRFPFDPRCGFSKKVAAAVTGTGVEYGTFDILGDEEIRSGLKEYSDWWGHVCFLLVHLTQDHTRVCIFVRLIFQV